MENTVLIQNLHKNVDVSILCEAFQDYGRILSANIEIDKNMRSIGKAKISFDNYGSAINAVKYMNGKIILDKLVHVTLYLDNQSFKKIFVKNLTHEWDEADIVAIFSAVGNVTGVFKSRVIGNSNGYAFVSYESHAEAEKAVRYFNNREIKGQKLHVERFKSKSEINNIMQNSIEHAEALLENSTQKNNLHIKNLPKDMDEVDLKDYFQRFGQIISHKIVYDDDGNSRGFGFVCYESIESAAKAKRKTNGIILNGKTLEVDFKQDGFARRHYLTLKNKESEQKRYKQRSKSSSALQFHPHSLKHTLMKI